MKRKLLLALIALTCALCLVFSLAGCNPAANQSGAQQGGNSDDEKPDTHNYIFKCSQTEHWQVCTDCGEETAHTPHSVSDGVCPACGYVEKCTEGLEFGEIIINEEAVGYYVFSKGEATDSHIFIPSFYNNLPVISIGYGDVGASYHFYCTSLTEITIGNNVILIYNSAFSGCANLTKITIPDSVTSIGLYAFLDCTSLTEITIPASVTSIGLNAFSNTAYYNDDTNWKNDVLYIGNYLIDAKHTLSGSYQITTGTKLIADSAFFGCTSLTDITIPDSVTSIGLNAFSNTAYYDDADNWKNDVLYIGNYLIEAKDTLSGSYQITPGTKLIVSWAFYGCTSITKITIPNSVTSIGESAFFYCTSLTEITIPDSVTSIGCWAFSDCTSLERVIFENNAGWKVSESYDMANFEEINVSDPEQNAENLKYTNYYWKRGE